MATETQISICEECLNNIENMYERHIWQETCRLSGLYKKNFIVLLDDDAFENYLMRLEKHNYIKYRNIKKNKVIIKPNCAILFKDKITYCVSPKEHLIEND